MLTTVRQFRVVQVFCILVVLACFRVALKMGTNSTEITPIHWVVIAMGLGQSYRDSYWSERLSGIQREQFAPQLDLPRSVGGEQATSFELPVLRQSRYGD